MIKELDRLDKNLIDELNNSFNYVLKDVLKDLDNNPFSHYLLFIEDKKVIGYINYYLMYDRLEIANFNVLEDYQNKHIGTKLLKELIRMYQDKVDNITLEVKNDNEKAIYIYQKLGFVSKTIRKNYYNGVDGILMELEMKK